MPFVQCAVSDDHRLIAAIRPALDLDLPLEDLQRDEILVDLAQVLAAADRAPVAKATPPDRPAVQRARAYLDAHTEHTVRSDALEAVCGLDRYALARQFRQSHGTSPYRYLLLRRLDRARALVAAGTSLVEVALAVGFADQSHLTGHFKRAYGLAPGRWAALCGAGSSERPSRPAQACASRLCASLSSWTSWHTAVRRGDECGRHGLLCSGFALGSQHLALTADEPATGRKSR